MENEIEIMREIWDNVNKAIWETYDRELARALNIL